jgi:hypothetical protein
MYDDYPPPGDPNARRSRAFPPYLRLVGLDGDTAEIRSDDYAPAADCPPPAPLPSPVRAIPVTSSAPPAAAVQDPAGEVVAGLMVIGAVAGVIVGVIVAVLWMRPH